MPLYNLKKKNIKNLSNYYNHLANLGERNVNKPISARPAATFPLHFVGESEIFRLPFKSLFSHDRGVFNHLRYPYRLLGT